jgi:LuxR family transcriptional regulator, maltose regulon positive regulatory protein
VSGGPGAAAHPHSPPPSCACPLLATHLTFREIGERLYISQNTVKTQAISVYRKLGVSSRGQAVQRVQAIGLLGA